MNLRQAGTPNNTFSTPDSSMLPSAPAFVVPPSYIGDIGGDLTHDMSLIFASSDSDYEESSSEIETAPEAKEELGIVEDLPRRPTQLGPFNQSTRT